MNKKINKKNICKLFAWNENCKLEIVEMETNLRMDFIKRFGTENIPVKTEFDNWIELMK